MKVRTLGIDLAKNVHSVLIKIPKHHYKGDSA